MASFVTHDQKAQLDAAFARLSPQLAEKLGKIEAQVSVAIAADRTRSARRIRAYVQRNDLRDIKDLIGTIAQGVKDGHAKAAEAARKAEAEQVVAKAVERTIAFR